MTCDGCDRSGITLTKRSLGRDFFGNCYDRLTPMTDKTPAWYCPACSKQKVMQVDCRVIAAAWAAFVAGDTSPLVDVGTRQRSRKRLHEIQRYLTCGGDASDRLLDAALLAKLCQAMDVQAGYGAMQAALNRAFGSLSLSGFPSAAGAQCTPPSDLGWR